MSEQEKQLAGLIAKGFLVQALLEDYCQQMAKLSGETPEAIQERVMKRAKELLAKF